MGKSISSFFISVDGVVESPNLFVFPYFSAQVGAAVSAATEQSVAMLMGRGLYQEWSQYWPTSKDEPFATFVNGVDKYVISDSLTEANWNNTTIIRGDEAEERVGRLRAETDGAVGVSGSPTTVRWLIQHGLLDELHLLVFPIAVGEGTRLFADARVPLTLISSEALDTGVLHVVYGPAAS